MNNSIHSWNITDPGSPLPLHEVQPVSARALSLIVRNKGTRILETGFINIQGGIEMMEGLNYHFDRLCTIQRLAADQKADHAALRHEAVAYINRAGQFYNFATSAFGRGRLQTIDPASLIPDP